MRIKDNVIRFVDRFKSLPNNATPLDAVSINIDQFKRFPIQYRDRLSLLRKCLLKADSKGYALEFGVYKAESISFLAKLSSERQWFGFDSFVGLPEAWVRSEISTYEPGHFALEALPKVPANVTLVKGMFEDSLPGWLQTHSSDISFLHIDADLYSSAKYILSSLNDRLKPGAIIVFDELSDWNDSGVYANWQDGEWKALCEWVGEMHRNIGILGRGPAYSAGIVILR
jgi:hypothetical protein